MVVAAKAGLETLVALGFHQPKFNSGRRNAKHADEDWSCGSLHFIAICKL